MGSAFQFGAFQFGAFQIDVTVHPAIVIKDVRLFFAGYEPTTQHNRLNVEFEAEALDETTFGNSTRTMKGGIKRASVVGSGFFKAGANQVDPVYFESLDLQDAVFMVFPETIVEGSTSTGAGFGFKSDLLKYSPMVQRVGELQAFTIEAEGRGV